MSDVRLAHPDQANEGDFVCSGEIPIFDMAGFTWRHATKVVISTLRVYMKYTQVWSGAGRAGWGDQVSLIN